MRPLCRGSRGAGLLVSLGQLSFHLVSAGSDDPEGTGGGCRLRVLGVARRVSSFTICLIPPTANKFKYERFLRSNATVVATVYCPITFPPASVLMFKQRANGGYC